MPLDEKRKQAQQKYIRNHPDRRAATVKKYHETHKEEERIKNKERATKKRAIDITAGKKYRMTKAGVQAQRKSRLKRYGLTPENYDQMLIEQNNVCAICKQIETRIGVKYLSVDHNHKTGKVRGLLCHNCNRWLGILESEWAKEAYLYLERQEILNG